MKFTKKLVTVVAALCAASTLFLTGCGTKEDEYKILKTSGDDCSIEFTNDVGVDYARAFKTTATKHLSADMLVEIDVENSSVVNNTTNYTVGYVFNVNGDGSENNPYSFALVGVRYADAAIKYYVSYFTNVRSEDISSDNGNFVTRNNNAVEYELVPSGTVLNSNYFSTESKDGKVVKASVYIDVDAYAGTIEVDDKDNKYSSLKDHLDSYKISFAKSADDERGAVVTMSKESLNAAKKSYHKNVDEPAETDSSITLADKDAEDAPYGRFYVDQADLGFYAMVKKNSTLVCSMTRGEFVRSASTGDALIWNEETITNVR
ncbi:MAG: hypothetical protein J1F14_08275 [Treponema sp.]|nr:hypothetical protein [Treponema sp.]